VVIHEGTANGTNAIDGTPAVPWDGPIIGIAHALGDTTVDAIVAGHTHRVSNLMAGNILVTEGINAGASYSVLQLMVEDGDVTWAGGATRIAKDIGVTPRADVQAIVDEANADTAVLRNKVIGTQSIDIRRDLNRLKESAMGNLVADSMRAKYPGVDAAITNSGGLRADILSAPPSASEQPGEITWGEVFVVLPFGNRTVILTLLTISADRATRLPLPPCLSGVVGGPSYSPEDRSSIGRDTDRPDVSKDIKLDGGTQGWPEASTYAARSPTRRRTSGWRGTSGPPRSTARAGAAPAARSSTSRSCSRASTRPP
jgi:hypothetical protein